MSYLLSASSSSEPNYDYAHLKWSLSVAEFGGSEIVTKNFILKEKLYEWQGEQHK